MTPPRLPVSKSPRNDGRPCVSIVSHVYLDDLNRAKLDYLGKAVDLTLIGPDHYHTPYGLRKAEFGEGHSYRTRLYPQWFPVGIRSSTRWILASIDLGFRQTTPDVIHVENEAHSLSLTQALVSRRRYVPRAKVVVSLWANQRLVGGKAILLNFLERLMRPAIDFYIGGSADARKVLIEAGIPASKIAVFPILGVDAERLCPPSDEERTRIREELGIAPDEFVVGYVGRFVREKGVTDLVDAYMRFVEQVQRTRLLLVGAGPLKAELQALPSNALVASPGGIREVLPYYKAMDTLVLPSRTTSLWKEQFGMVLVEAMAMGVPVVGSSSGAIPEVIGGAGLIFREGDTAELATYLGALYSSSDERGRLRRLGRSRALENFSAKRIAEQTLDVYGRVLQSAGPS